jgi:hypothetical protein
MSGQIAAAVAGEESAFATLTERHRRELHVLAAWGAAGVPSGSGGPAAQG